MRRHAFGLALGLAALGTLAPVASAQPSATEAAGTPAPVTATDGEATAAPAAPAGGASAAGADASSTAAPAVPIPDQPTMDGATYSVRLRDLEARVDELKAQIRRSHARLALLSDTILSGGASGARAEVTFRNEMSNAFRLTRALFVVDGAVQFNRQDDSGALADQREIPIFKGSISPGDHTVQVILNFQGNGYGVFTYLRGYKFEVKSAHSFTAVEGKNFSLVATALERGGVTTPLEQRPTVEWTEKFGALGPAGGGASPASAGANGAGAPGASGSVRIGGGK